MRIGSELTDPPPPESMAVVTDPRPSASNHALQGVPTPPRAAPRFFRSCARRTHAPAPSMCRRFTHPLPISHPSSRNCLPSVHYCPATRTSHQMVGKEKAVGGSSAGGCLKLPRRVSLIPNRYARQGWLSRFPQSPRDEPRETTRFPDPCNGSTPPPSPLRYPRLL